MSVLYGTWKQLPHLDAWVSVPCVSPWSVILKQSVCRTGEIGLIKILSCVKFHEGVRIELMCGSQALNYLSAIHAQNHEVSTLLSAKPLQTAAAVRRVLDERADALYRLTFEENRRFAETAGSLAGAGDCLLFEEGLTPDGVRKLCVAVIEKCGGRCAVFSGADGEGYRYAICHKGGELRAFTKAMHAALGGRGGGTPTMIQGSCTASEEDIRAFFESFPRG